MTDSAISGTPYMFWAIGILLAGAVLAYVAVNRRRSRSQKTVSDNAAERLYDAENRDPANR